MKGNMTFHEREALQLLLVKAIEEEQPAVFDEDILAKAALAALDADSDSELLEKRAASLSFHVPKPLKNLDWIALLPENWLVPSLTVAFLIGIASNYLGPTGQVHVAYNPIVFLLLWNLGVYVILLWFSASNAKRSWTFKTNFPSNVDEVSIVDTSQEHEAPGREGSPLFPRAVRYLLPRLWAWFTRWYLSFWAWQAGLKDFGRVLGNFFEHYFRVARPVFLARARYLIHLCAISLTLGAIAGIYLRGLFFEYRAIWRSTFITDPAIVSVLLNAFLLPASLIIDGTSISATNIENLLQPEGVAAAP